MQDWFQDTEEINIGGVGRVGRMDISVVFGWELFLVVWEILVKFIWGLSSLLVNGAVKTIKRD